MKTKFLVLILLGILSAGCKESSNPIETKETDSQSSLSSYDIVDLTHDFSEETIYWVTAKEFELDVVAKGPTEQGFYYSANNFTGAEHGGTHIDAPIHFAENRLTVDAIPLKNLVGRGIKINVSEKTINNPDYQVSIEDFKYWEQEEHMQIPDSCIILIETGYSKFYPDKQRYLGTDQRGPEAVKLLHFPGISPEAAQWLVIERNIHAIGLDTPSLDFGQSIAFKSHVILLSENIPGFENLTNLDKLPAKGFEIIALPMKIKGGSGGPLRIIALVKE